MGGEGAWGVGNRRWVGFVGQKLIVKYIFVSLSYIILCLILIV